MTTKVTVDAHAGRPVRITNISPDGGHTEVLVEPNTVHDFYVHSTQDLRVHEVQPNEQQSFGEKAVGLAFNPSGDSRVHRLKALYAEIIDICNTVRASDVSGEAKRHWSVAITDAETAQMRAVKAATWK
jgi:hypothetical protein